MPVLVKVEAEETISHAPEVLVDPALVKINDAGQCWRTVLVRMPEGSTADDLRNPKIWKRVQLTKPVALIKMDQLLILGHDESWYTRAIVTNAESTAATIVIEKVSKFRSADERLYSDGTLEVFFDGGAYEPASSLPLQAFDNESLWDQWDKSGGANLQHSRVMQTASWILHGLPEQEQQNMAGSFDNLPDDVVESVRRELALTPDSMAASVPDEALKRFAETDFGNTLAKAWRGKAAKKLAIVDRRLTRIEERLSDEGLFAARVWFAGLSPQAKVNVMWFLAG